MTAPGFWEVGASGRVYTRDFVIEALVDRYSRPHEDVWVIHDFQARQLSDGLWLATLRTRPGRTAQPPRNHLAAHPFPLGRGISPGHPPVRAAWLLRHPGETGGS